MGSVVCPGDRLHRVLRSRACGQTLQEQQQNGFGPREAILEGFEEACRRISAQGGGSATTLAVSELRGSSLRTYHTGDSEIFLSDAAGNLRWKTVPHSPVGYGVEAGLLDPREAIYHEARHLVSNVLGAIPISVDVSSTLELTAGDTLLLASDGLLDNLHAEEVLEAMNMTALQDAATALAQGAGQRMTHGGGPSKPDDLTFILYRHGRDRS